MEEGESMVANMSEVPEGMEQCWGDVYGIETDASLRAARNVVGEIRHSGLGRSYPAPRYSWRARESLVRKIRRENPRPYAAEERDNLARKLDFPRMLVDVDSQIHTPLAKVIAQAQEGIDEGLAQLTEDERERYLAASAYAVLALFPSGALHLVTIEHGKLELWDEAEPEAVIAYLEENADDCDDLRSAAEGVALRDAAEVLAFASLAGAEERCPGLNAQEEWDYIAPIIRSGRIGWADVIATEFETTLFGLRSRANECLALRRLVGEQGWPVAYTSEALEFIVGLHHLAGDVGYDAAEELIAAGDALERVLMDIPWAWDVAVCHNSAFGYEDDPDAYGGLTEDFKRDAHDVLYALYSKDCQGTKGALGMLRQAAHQGILVENVLGRVGAVELGGRAFVDVIGAYKLSRAAADKGADVSLTDLGLAVTEKRSEGLVRAAAALDGLPAGRYPARIVDPQGLSLQTRLDNLRLEMDGVALEVRDSMGDAGCGDAAHALKRFVTACMEAFFGIPRIGAAGSGLGRDDRGLVVDTVLGPTRLSDKKLGIRWLRGDAEMLSVWESMGTEAQDKARVVMAQHWANLLASFASDDLRRTRETYARGCDMRSWIRAGGDSDEGRLASFLAVLHRVAYRGEKYYSRKISSPSTDTAFSSLWNLSQELDAGLARLGLVPTGLFARLNGMCVDQNTPRSSLGMRGRGMRNAIIDNGVLLGFDGAPGHVVLIPETVTAIGPHAFWDSSVRSVRLPDALERIGGSAFYHCCMLEEIVLPEGLELVAAAAFCCCSGLRRVVLPNTLVSIESSAFAGCSGLRSVEVSGAVGARGNANPYDRLIIGTGAFANCPALENLSLPPALMVIDRGAFACCVGLKELLLPVGLQVIGKDAFLFCTGLARIVFPEGLASIGRSAFLGCSGLSSIWIPDKTRIDQRAFMNCSRLKNVRMPQDTRTLSDSVFAGCSSLSEIDLPEGLEVIEAGAFEGCSALASVRIPNSVKRIGRHAFYGTAIREVVLPEGARADGAFEDGVMVTYGA